ncbi:MAG: hypothetical protein R3A47_11140 [Polyangiales bacterium]
MQEDVAVREVSPPWRRATGSKHYLYRWSERVDPDTTTASEHVSRDESRTVEIGQAGRR